LADIVSNYNDMRTYEQKRKLGNQTQSISSVKQLVSGDSDYWQ